jgi:hypothetical protein
MKNKKRFITLRNIFLLVFVFFMIPSFYLFKTKETHSQTNSTNAQININYQVIDSYTPPFYEGRGLAGEQAYIKAIAEVKISTLAGDLDPSKLFYAWEYNGHYLYDYSDTNSKIIYFTLDQLKNVNTLKLSIYLNNRQENLLGEKTIQIYPHNSVIALYRQDDNPLITYSNAINKKYETYQVATDENFNIIAEPFYFSVKNPIDKDIFYEWGLNGIVGNDSATNIFNYSAPSNPGYGSGITLKLSNENVNKNMQEGETLIKFNVNQKRENSGR